MWEQIKPKKDVKIIPHRHAIRAIPISARQRVATKHEVKEKLYITNHLLQTVGKQMSDNNGSS